MGADSQLGKQACLRSNKLPLRGPLTGPPQPSNPLQPLRVVMNGNRLDIQASVDLAGLKKLKDMLTKYESILEMMQPDAKENIFK